MRKRESQQDNGGERWWWCVKCGICHRCHPEPGVAVRPREASRLCIPRRSFLFEFIGYLVSGHAWRRHEFFQGQEWKIVQVRGTGIGSGVYEVLHSNPHVPKFRDLYFEGSRFPECGSCRAGVFYRLESPCTSALPVPEFTL